MCGMGVLQLGFGVLQLGARTGYRSLRVAVGQRLEGFVVSVEADHKGGKARSTI